LPAGVAHHATHSLFDEVTMSHASVLAGNMQRHTLTVRPLLEHAERHHADAEIVSRRIEGDHQEFVNLARALLHASDHEMGATLQAVKAGTEQQFVDEDQWIQESGFPGFGCRADERAAVLASMSCVSRKVAAGNTQAARVYARALIDWHAGHAKYLDSALADWIASRGAWPAIP